MMAGIMAVAAVVAMIGLRGGRQEEPGHEPDSPDGAHRAAGQDDSAIVPPGRGA